MKRYAGMLCFSKDYKRLAVLTKRHGPESLIGKLNFPGGNLEEGEAALDAALREMWEETGVQLPKADVEFVWAIEVANTYSLNVFSCASDLVLDARTMTDEEVTVIDVAELLAMASVSPEKLSPDLAGLVEHALALAEQAIPVKREDCAHG